MPHLVQLSQHLTTCGGEVGEVESRKEGGGVGGRGGRILGGFFVGYKRLDLQDLGVDGGLPDVGAVVNYDG